ncbi:MAG: transglycosylase SLT domain-containing protein, partial [Azospirillum sp.]|nr:transglycosylase SLT domain-containing protein [Azospirillum sp.]
MGAGAIVRREDNRRPVPQTANDLLAIINANNADGWHDPRDVLATIAVESSFNPAAYRFEPHLGEASYGLMQILWSTARQMERGLTDPSQLYDPETNIRIGMLYQRWTFDFLRRRLGRDPSQAEWLSAYNAGVGNVLKGV